MPDIVVRTPKLHPAAAYWTTEQRYSVEAALSVAVGREEWASHIEEARFQFHLGGPPPPIDEERAEPYQVMSESAFRWWLAFSESSPFCDGQIVEVLERILGEDESMLALLKAGQDSALLAYVVASAAKGMMRLRAPTGEVVEVADPYLAEFYRSDMILGARVLETPTGTRELAHWPLPVPAVAATDAARLLGLERRRGCRHYDEGPLIHGIWAHGPCSTAARIGQAEYTFG